MIVDPDRLKSQPISKTAHEARRKLARQQQREIVIDWSTLAREAMAAFATDTGFTLYSTAGRQLRVLDRRQLRKLLNNECWHLWSLVTNCVKRRGAKHTVWRTEAGLRAIGLMAPMTGEVAR